MEISKKTDYALRMLVCLVQNPGRIVSARAAAEENGVPYSFARAIQHDLASHGIVESIRGAHGGMRLAIDPHETPLLDIIEAVQGPVEIATCVISEEEGEPCPRKDTCPFNPIWCTAERMLRDYLASVSLYDVVMNGLSPDVGTAFGLTPTGR